MSETATSTAPAAAPTASTARPINKTNPHIVILGGGFGGLNLAKSLRNSKVRITLVDRQNHHLFQPLLYQVATAGLSSVEIAKPLRSILSEQENIQVELGDVQAIDLKERKVMMHHHSIEYDYIAIAMGGVTSYFGHPEWAEWAPGLKSITDALHIRREILYSFEKAELSHEDAERVQRLMTIVIVGGGPTGVELAGACKELGRFVMRHDFRNIDPTKIRVILIEAADRILMHLPRELSASGQRQLEDIGVEVRLNTMVKDIKQHTVVVQGKDKTETETLTAASIVWAAGVGANPITRTLGVDIDRAGRIKVNPDLSIPNYPEAFAIGDIAFILNKNGTPVPGVSPAAIQMGQFVARTIEADLADLNLKPEQRDHFKYWDKGTMATIGHSRAVAMIAGIKFSGFLAWLAWLGVHILFLVGFTNKLTVVIRWIWAYFTRRQGARVFTSDEGRGVTPMTTSPSTSMAASMKTD
jgi:NADH dehydrogenase